MAPFRSNSTYFRTRLLASLTTVSVPLAHQCAFLIVSPVNAANGVDGDMLCQVRGLDMIQKDKIFAIGYCFGGGGVLELARAWPNTPGLLGEYEVTSLCLHADSRANKRVLTVLDMARTGVGGFHAGPLVTSGPKAKLGRNQHHVGWRELLPHHLLCITYAL